MIKANLKVHVDLDSCILRLMIRYRIIYLTTLR
nr:MAG TPA: hypothetical protein [Caudoviricetes sp.]